MTGDKFSEPEDIEPLLEGPYRNENVLAFDMESAAFAQSALFYGVPFVSVRAINDILASRANSRILKRQFGTSGFEQQPHAA